MDKSVHDDMWQAYNQGSKFEVTEEKLYAKWKNKGLNPRKKMEK